MNHFYLKGLKPKEIKDELNEDNGTSAPSFTTGSTSFNVAK